MCAQSIAELESALEDERLTSGRQKLLKQIWKLQTEQALGSSQEHRDQPTSRLSSVSTHRKEGPRAIAESSSASTAV